MKDWLLTDEETRSARLLGGQEYMVAVQGSIKIPSLDDCCNRRQNLAQVKKLVKYLEGFICPECSTPNFPAIILPLKEWQALKKEIGE